MRRLSRSRRVSAYARDLPGDDVRASRHGPPALPAPRPTCRRSTLHRCYWNDYLARYGLAGRTAFLSIDAEPGRYQRITLRLDGEAKPRVFASGDPVADWKAASEAAYRNAGHVTGSSSVDEFAHIVPGYRWGEDDVLERVEGPAPSAGLRG